MKTKQQITVEHRHTMILMMVMMRMLMIVMLVMVVVMMMGQGPFQIIATASGEDAFETNGCQVACSVRTTEPFSPDPSKQVTWWGRSAWNDTPLVESRSHDK